MAWGVQNFNTAKREGTPDFTNAAFAASKIDQQNAMAEQQAKADMLNGAMMGAQVYNYGMGKDRSPIADKLGEWFGGGATETPAIAQVGAPVEGTSVFAAGEPTAAGITSMPVVDPMSVQASVNAVEAANAGANLSAGLGAGSGLATAPVVSSAASAAPVAPIAGGAGGIGAAMPWIGGAMLADQALLDGQGMDYLTEDYGQDMTDLLATGMGKGWLWS
jgi:hypothetical protein